MDEPFVYNRVLSVAEIVELMNQTRPGFGQERAFRVTCDFSSIPDEAYCRIGSAAKRMTIVGLSGAAEFVGEEIGTGAHSIIIGTKTGGFGNIKVD